MWMQNSVGGGSGNFHDRNRFGSQYAQSYSGGASHSDAGDWKSKILESGQWLGGKVIESGGKLARGPHSDSISDHYAPQMPRNDGRANWMADIRSSSSGGGGGYNGGYSGGGYQNDFATERPKAYSDYGNSYSSNPTSAKPYGGYEPKSGSSDHHKSRHAKKKSEGKKKKKNKKKQQSDSESDSVSERSEELSISESSTESADERRHKSKSKHKKKTKVKKHSGFYSESESEDDGKRKVSADYSFSFDPAKLPPPPEDEKKTSKKSKTKKSKKEKSSKKSRTRRQSVASTDDESASEKEKAHATAKKRNSKKTTAADSASVDLLGVDLDAQSVTQPTTAGLPAQAAQPSIFDAPQHQNPLQDLAGLSFAAPVQAPGPVRTQPSVFDASAPSVESSETQTQPQQQVDAFRTNLLPENNIVDFSSLASEKKKALSANPEEKRTLNDMQKARGADQPTPVMAMPMQGQQQIQQQSMSSGMMQLSMNMNQLQITDGVTGMQQQMYPNMQMPMQSMNHPQMLPQVMMMQPQMGMMAQPQMMTMQMMQQQQQQPQQFTQSGASMTQLKGAQQTSQGMMSGASNSNSSDPYHQLP
ncbi:Hypothetical protein PHPALM_20460 [Phytophthora palmivora]|uniref:Uncharacterized protein n=1 Tax=Phytophthora palmivora TaxID=4796 RepID=A0A2P4XET1_9STRA|nr:Hypothetical protein PHPALM_20460 [Phytophthora palmivora]